MGCLFFIAFCLQVSLESSMPSLNKMVFLYANQHSPCVSKVLCHGNGKAALQKKATFLRLCENNDSFIGQSTAMKWELLSLHFTSKYTTFLPH